ncbi:MAG: hypothetical protein RR528_07705 [Angelakisella sp.]
MNDKTMAVAKRILGVVIFAGAISAVVVGQRNIGAPWLGLMLLGVAALIALLFFYNQKYQ